jgi:hypothetical protein
MSDIAPVHWQQPRRRRAHPIAHIGAMTLAERSRSQARFLFPLPFLPVFNAFVLRVLLITFAALLAAATVLGCRVFFA